jgi:DNA repair protein RadC
MKIIREEKREIKISDAEQVRKYLKEFQEEDREHFIVLGLDTKNKILYREVVTIGILDACIIHPREVFKKAVMMSCSKIILAHNHPSGDPTPSQEDLDITKKIMEAGEILDIKVLDHVIIGKDKYWSYSEENPSLNF